MTDNPYNVTVGLLIKTEQEPPLISEIMELSPSKIIRNDKVTRIVNEQDWPVLWVYREHYREQNDVDNCVEHFFGRIPNIKKKISAINQIGIVKLRVSLVSYYGQFGFGFSPNIIQLLSDLDISLDVSIFSYGMCIDE